MYEQNKHPIPFDVANGLAEMLDVKADLLYDDFAVFLATPYSEALKAIRMSIGMYQRAFAEHIGVIPSYYYKLESGHRRPSRKVYLRIRKYIQEQEIYDQMVDKLSVKNTRTLLRVSRYCKCLFRGGNESRSIVT